MASRASVRALEVVQLHHPARPPAGLQRAAVLEHAADAPVVADGAQHGGVLLRADGRGLAAQLQHLDGRLRVEAGLGCVEDAVDRVGGQVVREDVHRAQLLADLGHLRGVDLEAPLHLRGLLALVVVGGLGGQPGELQVDRHAAHVDALVDLVHGELAARQVAQLGVKRTFCAHVLCTIDLQAIQIARASFCHRKHEALAVGVLLLLHVQHLGRRVERSRQPLQHGLGLRVHPAVDADGREAQGHHVTLPHGVLEQAVPRIEAHVGVARVLEQAGRQRLARRPGARIFIVHRPTQAQHSGARVLGVGRSADLDVHLTGGFKVEVNPHPSPRMRATTRDSMARANA